MNTPEVILCKFGEVVLKGANRQNFESSLIKELRRRASPHGIFKIYFKQSTVYVEPQNELCDMDAMYETAKKVFGDSCNLRTALAVYEEVTLAVNKLDNQFNESVINHFKSGKKNSQKQNSGKIYPNPNYHHKKKKRR